MFSDIPSPKYEIEIEDEQPQEHMIVSTNEESNGQSRRESDENSNDSLSTVALNQIDHGVECVVVLERADDLVAQFSKRPTKHQKKLRKKRSKKRCPISSDTESDDEPDVDLPSVSNSVPLIESDSETLPTSERQSEVEHVDEVEPVDEVVEIHPVSPQRSQSPETPRASVICPGPRQVFDYGDISPIELSSSSDNENDDTNKTNKGNEEANQSEAENQIEAENQSEAAPEDEIIDISSDDECDIEN